jgi:hypothetical protein
MANGLLLDFELNNFDRDGLAGVRAIDLAWPGVKT